MLDLVQAYHQVLDRVFHVAMTDSNYWYFTDATTRFWKATVYLNQLGAPKFIAT